VKNKNIIISLFLLIATIAVIAVVYSYAPKPVDWSPTFERKKDTPFGSKLIFENLKDVFPKSKIVTNNKSLYDHLDDAKLKNTNYIIISNKLDLYDVDMRALLNYVADGNNVFISTNELSYHFQDTIGCYFNMNFSIKDIIPNKVNAKNNYTHTFTNKSLGKNYVYNFKRMFDPTIIYIADTLAYKVLAVDDKKNPVFVSTKYGNGNLYLHSYPYAFSNYYLLYKNNNEYISKCLSILPEKTTVFWDEYYKKDQLENQKDFSPIKFILKTPALKWAWYITLLSLLVYVIFRVKRQQRIIPILKPFENTSLQFIKTVGRLYFNKGDHNDIIKKQIAHWLEYIRSKLIIPTATLDSKFIESVSEKSGIEKYKIEEIIYVITDLKNGGASKNDVINLYKKLEYFYKNSKR
jgi:hypothetical protein